MNIKACEAERKCERAKAPSLHPSSATDLITLLLLLRPVARLIELNDGRRGKKRCKQGEQDRRRRGESRRSSICHERLTGAAAVQCRWFDPVSCSHSHSLESYREKLL